MPTVIAIPATRREVRKTNSVQAIRRKVVGYARVSTDHDEQLTSYEAQMEYYTRYIKEHDGWEYAGMYSDEGITATNTKNRDGFNQMVTDALAGKFNLIITKSVSRFARNTVDSLVTVRKLKEAGVEVYFEKENIWTLDSKGELLITIMSSLAQEESRNISENTTWGQRKRFADGKVSVPFGRFLGYDRGENGGLVVNPGQAAIVRKIYSLFLQGKTLHGIKRILEGEGILSPGGKKSWSLTTIRSILTNEKYKGDALLQKSFTVDFLTKKKKKNEGEVQQYYVEGAHEAIVTPAIFEMVQREMERRKGVKGNKYNCTTFLSGKIKCGECGSWFGPKVWHSNDKYRRTVYQCNHKYNGEYKCSTPTITEDDVRCWFVDAVNKIYKNRNDILVDMGAAMSALDHQDELVTKQEELESWLEQKHLEIDALILHNASQTINQDSYQKKFDRLTKEYEKGRAELDSIAAKLGENRSRKEMLHEFIDTIRDKATLVEDIDENLWMALFDCLVVNSMDDVRFILKDGREIKV